MESDDIPSLAADGSNWAIYHERMVLMLGALSLVDHLNNAETPKSGAEAETVEAAQAAIRWEHDDAIVKQYIQASIPDDVLEKIKGGTSAKDFWHSLKALFEFKSRRIRYGLERRLYNQQCRKRDNVRTHFASMDSLREQLAAAGKSIPDDEYAYLLLTSLPKAYNDTVSIVNAIASFSKKDLLPDVVTSLITKEYEEKISKRFQPKSAKKGHRRRSVLAMSKGNGGQCPTLANGEGMEEVILGTGAGDDADGGGLCN
jgi:hypothetical protein